MYEITDQTKRKHFFRDAVEADALIARLKAKYGAKLKMRGRRLPDEETKEVAGDASRSSLN